MAAGDLALGILIKATDMASPVMVGTASTMAEMGKSAAVANTYLASLGERTFSLMPALADLADENGIVAGAFDGMAHAAVATATSLDVVDTTLAETNIGFSEAAAGLDEAGAAASTAGDQTAGFGSKIQAAFGSIMQIVSALQIVVPYIQKAVQAAQDFQGGMTSLVTGAGELQSNLDMVSQGVLKISVDTATSTDQLTKGLYMIESAGYHGAAGLQVLQTAAQGAKVGNADLGVVSNALTTILTDYHLKASDAASVMNALTTTVASGKTHMQDLASAMGAVLPLASSLGVSFPQVAGALATMTNSGMSAQNAAQNLANTIRSLAAPNSAATKSMNEVGISAQQLKDTLSHQGLAAAIQEVSDAVGQKFPAGSVQAVEAFKHIMGGATGYNVALMLGGKNMEAYQGNIKNISGAMSAGGKSVQGWSAIQGDFNFKIEQAKQILNVLMITLGTALLPILGRILSAVTPVVASFTTWISSGDKTKGAMSALSPIISTLGPAFTNLGHALANLGNAVAPLVTGFAQWLVQSGTLHTVIAGIVGAVGLVVITLTGLINGLASVIIFFEKNRIAAAALLIPLGALVGIFIMLAVNAIASFLASIPMMVVGFLAGASAAWAMAAGVIAATWPFILLGIAVVAVIAIIVLAVQHWGDITKWLQGVWTAIANFFVGLWNDIKTAAVNAWNGLINGIKGIIGGAVKWLEDTWNHAVNTVVGWFLWLYNHNYYFKDLVDEIVKQFTITKNFIIQVWNTIVSFLTGIWNRIWSNTVQGWNTISSTIISWNNNINKFIQGIWNAVVTWIMGIWNQIAANTARGWATISDIFGGAWNTYIAGPLGGLWNQFTGWFGKLATSFSNFGGDLMHQLASGISGASGVVGNAIHGAIGNALSALGFHGIPGFATGVQNFQGGLAMVGENGPELMYLPYGSSVYTQAQMKSMFAPPSNNFAISRPTSNQPQTMNLQINMDGKQITQVVGVRLAKEIRLQAGVRNA